MTDRRRGFGTKIDPSTLRLSDDRMSSRFEPIRRRSRRFRACTPKVVATTMSLSVLERLYGFLV